MNNQTHTNFFTKLKNSLAKTKKNFGLELIKLFRHKKINKDLFTKLEKRLLVADVGIETTRKIIDKLTNYANLHNIINTESLYDKLYEEMKDILLKVEKPLILSDKRPFVILIVGVNGVGKTTTIAKLANHYKNKNKSVMFAAGDTLRPAAIEQLKIWGKRSQISVLAQHIGADSASVIFDAIQSSRARNIDILIADTAGRLHNKLRVTEELKKIVRVIRKLDQEAPHEIMLILDANTGQNSVNQANIFNEAIGITGISLTKLDSTAKGGIIFNIADQLKIPIRYVGVGENIDDLRDFKAIDFIKAILF